METKKINFLPWEQDSEINRASLEDSRYTQTWSDMSEEDLRVEHQLNEMDLICADEY